MKTLDVLVSTPLSMKDVSQFLPNVSVILYKDFAKLIDLPFVIVYLFLTSDGYGHWCSVFRRGAEVELFDSYGIPPESEHNFARKEVLRHLRERKTFILDLCKKKGYSVTHNPTRLQSWNTKVETCGRHVVQRVRMSNVDVKTYVQWLLAVSKSANTTPDYVVSFLVE